MAPTGMAIPYPANNPEITAVFISGTSCPDGIYRQSSIYWRSPLTTCCGEIFRFPAPRLAHSRSGHGPLAGRLGGKYVLMAALVVLAAVAVTLRVS